MGRYIDWTHVVNRYPDAAKIAPGESVNSAWIPGAEAEVEARLGKRYAVPFAGTPPLVQDLCVDLTYCRMTVRQEETQAIYDRAQSLIKDIVAGTLPLLTGSGTLLATAGSSLAWASNSYRSAFGPDDAENWSPSQSKIDDAMDERSHD